MSNLESYASDLDGSSLPLQNPSQQKAKQQRMKDSYKIHFKLHMMVPKKHLLRCKNLDIKQLSKEEDKIHRGFTYAQNSYQKYTHLEDDEIGI
jgi:hypothetical protein